MSKIISKEEKEKIVEYYSSEPMTLSKLKNKYNYSLPTLAKILNEYGCKTYAKASVYNPQFKQTYFDDIDTEHKAYFLGLLIADGCVHIPSEGNRQSSISITLQNKDDYVLHELKKEICTNTNVIKDKRGCSNIAFRSNYMANSLYCYGIVDNKTEKAYLPILENDDMMKHLLRGLIDGDGNLKSKMNKSNKHVHSIGICGTPMIVEGVKDYLMSKFNLSNRKSYYYSDTFGQICWNSIEDVYAIGEYIYSDANIYLKRKKEIFDDFVKHYNLKTIK